MIVWSFHNALFYSRNERYIALPESSTPTRNHAPSHHAGEPVLHWGRIWLGKHSQPFADRPSRFVWVLEPEQILVSEQVYGQPRWMETLQLNMVQTARELLEDASPEYESIRVQVQLWTTLQDGSKAQFTVQYVERKSSIGISKNGAT